MDCQCSICQSACNTRPGWFAPNEIAEAAKLLNMTEQEFFDTYIGVDYYIMENPVFVLAPITENNTPGSEYPFNPHGKCVFFQQGLCKIHNAKPNECKFYIHNAPLELTTENRKKIVNAWKNNQDKIKQLLKRQPIMPSPSRI